MKASVKRQLDRRDFVKSIGAAAAGIGAAASLVTDETLEAITQNVKTDSKPSELKITDLSAQYQREGRREGMIGALTGVLLVVAVYFMVIKPGL